jgi:hypothetical protein
MQAPAAPRSPPSFRIIDDPRFSRVILTGASEFIKELVDPKIEDFDGYCPNRSDNLFTEVLNNT